jgi:O-antigen/teichoic acid export membrane protein
VSIRTLSVDFAFYGLLDLLQRSVGIIMVPVYTRVLSQKEYGNLDIILIFSSVLLILVDLQFIAGFSRLYYEHRTAGTGKHFVGTAIISRLVGGITISAGFLILGFFGAIEFNFLPSFKYNTTTWIIAVLTIPISLTYEILLLQTRMLRWKKWFAIGSLSNCILSCVLSAFFAVVLGWGIVSVVLGLFIGMLVGLVLLGWGLRKEVELCFDIIPFKELIRYSMPLIPGWWLAFGSAYVSRFFVFAQMGASENAILAVCMKIAGVIGLFSVSFETAWRPLAMSHIGVESGNAFYVRSMRLFIAGSIFSMFCLTAFLDPILSVLAPSTYSVVKYYFPLFAVGMVLSACANNLQLGNQIAKTTHWISISAFISIAINVIILIALTKSYGIFAAGFAWVMSFTAKDLIMYYSAQKNYHIPYDNNSFIFLGSGCAMLLLLGYADYRQLITGWLFTSCVASLGLIIPWFVFPAFERQVMKKFVIQLLTHILPVRI